jgi:hypothetical protein
VVIGLLAAFAIGVMVYIKWLQKSREVWKAEAQIAHAINEANQLELDIIKNSQEISNEITKEREVRLLKENKKLNETIKQILAHDKSKDCPVSDSINDLLNGLPTDSENQDSSSPTPGEP